MDSMAWLVLSIVLYVVEACTAALVCIWFALGATAAFVCSMCGLGTAWCVGVFVVVSAITLLCTRKFVKKFTNGNKVATNVDALIGKQCVVSEKIEPLAATGAVMVNGVCWSAVSENGEIIGEGETVTILKITGVKLVVKA